MSNVIKLKGRVDAQRLVGKINLVPSENAGGPLQAKTVYPTHSEQSIAPDEDYYGLAVVKVLAVPKLPLCEVSVASEGENRVETVVNIGVVVDITAEDYAKPATHALYNGVRLPIIPEDALAQYPYAWIRNNDSTGYYDLIMSSSPWWLSSNSPSAVTISTENYAQGIQWYRVEKASAENAESWVFNQVWNTSGGFGAETNRPIMWSSHDIPSGSADATEIYFAGTEPVPTD